MAGRPVGAKTVRYRSRVVADREGKYLACIRVPAELRPHLETQELRLSLHTKDVETARSLLPYVSFDLSAAMEYALRRVRQDELAAVEAEKWVHLDGFEATYTKLSPKDLLQEITATCAEPMRIRFNGAYSVEDPETRRLLRLVDDLIKDFNIPIKKYTQQYWKFCTCIEHLQRVVKPGTAPPPALLPAADSREHTLGEVIAEFEADVGTFWSSARRLSYGHAFGILVEVIKASTPITSLTRNDFREVRDIAEDLPPYWRVRKDTRSLPIREAANKARQLGLPRLSV